MARKITCYEVMAGKNIVMSIPLKKKDALDFKKWLEKRRTPMESKKYRNIRIKKTSCLKKVG